MKTRKLLAALAIVSAAALAAISIPLTITWDAPTARANGAALQPEEIKAYGLTITSPSGAVWKREVDGTLRAYSGYVGTEYGAYSIQVTAIDTEGRVSAPAKTATNRPEPAPPGSPVIKDPLAQCKTELALTKLAHQICMKKLPAN